ncbi:hypothetical protein Tco_1171754 [Tanacetum coccineum]
MARQSTKFSGKVTPLFESMLVQNQAPESEGSATPPEPQPTPSTSQLHVFEPQTETPPPVFYEPLSEAHIEQILPSPTTYQRKRKTKKCRRTKKDTKLPQTSVPQDLGADEAVHKEGTRSERVLEKPNEPPLSEGHTSGSREDRIEHQFELTANVPIIPHDSPLPGGYTLGSDEERQRKSSNSQPKRRKYRQFESSNDDLDEEDASKQGKGSDKIKPILVTSIDPCWSGLRLHLSGDEFLRWARKLGMQGVGVIRVRMDMGDKEVMKKELWSARWWIEVLGGAAW